MIFIYNFILRMMNFFWHWSLYMIFMMFMISMIMVFISIFWSYMIRFSNYSLRLKMMVPNRRYLISESIWISYNNLKSPRGVVMISVWVRLIIIIVISSVRTLHISFRSSTSFVVVIISSMKISLIMMIQIPSLVIMISLMIHSSSIIYFVIVISRTTSYFMISRASFLITRWVLF